MSALAAAAALVAIVTADQSALRAAPRDSAAQHAVLWQGDSLEIRGEKGDYLQVYDHRRERAGFIRAAQVRVHALKPEAAPELLAVARFLKDTPGAEALGISYAAAYLRAAPATAIDDDAFAALGIMADRLARRASAGQPGKQGAAIAAHLDVAAGYGVSMYSFERDGQIQVCYDGDAQRRLLARAKDDTAKAIAALALTRHDCVVPTLPPGERFALDTWRAEVLDRVALPALSPVWKNRLHLRKAGIWASLAYQRARRPELGAAAVREAAGRAADELAAIDKGELMETDLPAYDDAAIRVGASRWAALPDAPTAAAGKAAGVSLRTRPGQPGETCVDLFDGRGGGDAPVFSRCTYGIVWPASVALNPQGTALALAVQPLDTWRELWLFRRDGNAWSVAVLPPALDTGAPAYIEFAGWVPGGGEFLAARENKRDGRYRQSFELLSLTTLETKKQADKVNNLSSFYRWQSPAWKSVTVSLR